MKVLAQIVEARGGDVIAETRQGFVGRVSEAAAIFGLFEDPDIYTEVSRDESISILTSVMNQDMAYHVEIVSKDVANQLATDFIDGFKADGPRFYTNGTFGRPFVATGPGPTWTPATNATFDTGVLVIGQSSFGCVWFNDED